MAPNTSKRKEYDKDFGIELKLSEIVISFKKLINQISPIDVYNGEENIPFSKKEAEFRKVLKSEFLT
ncbi:MAG: hypothetical protein EAX91_09985 [Candidatus Lokiarchaeota archaeon]|nr:hypothetical protein [Candidatus Lokiarchaeota archaeon]